MAMITIQILLDHNDENTTMFIGLSDDGNLNLASLQAAFPGSTGIQVKQNGAWIM